MAKPLTGDEVAELEAARRVVMAARYVISDVTWPFSMSNRFGRMAVSGHAIEQLESTLDEYEGTWSAATLPATIQTTVTVSGSAILDAYMTVSSQLAEAFVRLLVDFLANNRADSLTRHDLTQAIKPGEGKAGEEASNLPPAAPIFEKTFRRNSSTD
jgi:hypothetical protein